MTDVYSPTTTANPQTSCLVVPSDTVGKARCGIKVVQVLLSFVAFVLEENVLRCSSCFALYFFEFVSCTAFLFTLLLLLLTTTTLQTRVGIKCWPKLDFVYTGVITVTFFVSSVIFATAHGDSSVEKAAVVRKLLLLLFVTTSSASSRLLLPHVVSSPPFPLTSPPVAGVRVLGVADVLPRHRPLLEEKWFPLPWKQEM
uniref:MARVEL domain-containing protein n=1 Tax=Gasterosteus aculeatus aculeatus TaxID=481459 RepID=A0AAQ4R141_GASAC